MPSPLILASRSQGRAFLLAGAGVDFEVLPVAVDEAAIREGMLREAAPARDIADALAETKARRGASKRPDSVVIGADQVLVCDGRIFDKPRDLAEAAEHLRLLRGKNHQLLSAAVVFEEARPVWRHIGVVRLKMRDFSDAFLADYVGAEGAALLDTVGAYRLEGHGAQLFTGIQGDYFSVLGLPLLELLAFLRTREICPT
jgi:septum formation protein